jgi:hypothetical protein
VGTMAKDNPANVLSVFLRAPMTYQDDLILSGVSAIAAEINRTPRRTYDLLAARKIPATKIGGTWTSTRNVLRAYVAAMAQGAE